MSDVAPKRPYVVALLILLWVAGTLLALVAFEIGRASCWERV